MLPPLDDRRSLHGRQMTGSRIRRTRRSSLPTRFVGTYSLPIAGARDPAASFCGQAVHETYSDDERQPDTSKLPKQGTVPTPATTSSVSASGAQSGSQSPLPPGWTQIESRSTGKIFFHNKATGETSWIKPSMDDANTAQAATAAASTSSVQTPSASSSQAASGTAPSASQKDAANGREDPASRPTDKQAQAEKNKPAPVENRRTAFPPNGAGPQRPTGPSGNDRSVPSGPAGWRNGSDRGRDDGPNRSGPARDERDRRDGRDSRDSRDLRDRRDRRRTRSPSARVPDDSKRFKPDNGYPDRSTLTSCRTSPLRLLVSIGGAIACSSAYHLFLPR